MTESPKEALATSARLVQDDLVLMVKRDGKMKSKVQSYWHRLTFWSQTTSITSTPELCVFQVSGG